jgi:hypothetical protein
MPAMLPQELEKTDLQIKRYYEEQDFRFQLALFDAVSKGLEVTPKCPHEINFRTAS